MQDENSRAEIWYNTPAQDQDVVVSTRVRLARNLASFPFPLNSKSDEFDRVQNIVFDAFSKFNHPDNYQIMALKNLDTNGEKILGERGLFDGTSGTGLITTLDGISACIVNDCDHVRISSFAPGLELEKAYERAEDIDNQMQQFVQFAASRDFGYLTSSVFNAGSGMKTSLRLHLPSLSFSGEIRDVVKQVYEKNYTFADCYGVGSFFNSALGAYYQVSSISSMAGSEIDQLASMSAVGKFICDLERKKRAEYADNKPTVVHNIVVRAYSLAKFTILLELRDCIDIISCLKWGLDLGFIAGVEDYELNSLLYRVQPGHLGYLLKTNDFNFEEDVENDAQLKENRLRAIILKSTVEKISFVS
ncbi:MAG: hypothetical protein J6X37_01640 [Treponema sp.]|nr:hypothetical protein [Treponema sp.]MBP5587418.1 hypothetical protein [Treponema sp.]MCR5386930.1 hypothetical protein [Treponema sp.]